MCTSLQYEYHKEHKYDSYALTIHSRFSITLMQHQTHAMGCSMRHMSHGVFYGHCFGDTGVVASHCNLCVCVS